ncbi:MAG: HD domain-containing phosphohydrolase [Pseudomonadota bacterium]
MKNHKGNIPFVSFRVRLMLLVLIVILPLLGLIVYFDIEEENQKRLSVLNESQKYAQNASLIYSQIIAEVRLTLYHLSLMPQFQQQDREACSRIFSLFLKQNKSLIGLAAAKSNGDVFASVPAIAKPHNSADRPWFQRLVQTRDFVIGEYSIGRISGKPIVVLGYPVLDLTGKLVTVISAGLDIEHLQKTLKNIELIQGANLTVIDSNGTVLFRFPDPEKLVGGNMPEESIIKAIMTQKEGVEEGIGLDGVRRLFGFTTIGSGIEAIHICVSTPEQIAFAEIRRQTVQDFALVGLVGVLGFLGAWLFGGMLIISPTKRLLNFTKRVADGDLTVRTGRSTDTGELGLLALHFDRMTESLQRREEERKQAEEALRANEEKYRIHFENVSDVIFSFDREFRILSISPSLERVLGYKPEDFIGKPFPELNILPPEYLEKAFTDGMRIFAGESIDSIIYELIARDGTRKYFELSATPLLRDGQVVAAVSVARDITERKRSEEVLRESEEQYRALVENIDFGVTMIDKDFKVIMTNAVLSKWTNKPICELVGKTCFKEFEKRQAVCQHCPGVKAMATARSHQVETEGVRDDGSPLSVLINAFPLFYPDGATRGFIEVIEDITDRKQVEKELRQTLENLRRALGTTIQVMVSAIEVRDPYTAGHQIRSADLARAIATEMGLPQEKIDGIRMAGSIHDIGKLSIPAEILSKPTKLTNIEFSLIKEHAKQGYEMLKDVESPWNMAEIVYQHHERMDGSGYPRNLKGDEILMEARILAVADVVEAMASHRPYRPGLGIDAALEEIEKNRGTFYDHAVADACLRLFREKGFQLAGT